MASPAFTISGVCQWLKVQLDRRYGKAADVSRTAQDDGTFLIAMEIDGLGTLDFFIDGELARSESAREITSRIEEAQVLPRFMASYYEPLILTAEGVKPVRS